MKKLIILLFSFLPFASLGQSGSITFDNYGAYRVWVRAHAINSSCSSQVVSSWHAIDAQGCGVNSVTISPIMGSTWEWNLAEVIYFSPTGTCTSAVVNADSWVIVHNSTSSCTSTYPTSASVSVSCNVPPGCGTGFGAGATFVGGYNVTIP